MQILRRTARPALATESANFGFRAPALLVATAQFMEGLDGTILANALPYMARDLGVAAVDLRLTITVYLVAVAVFVPLSPSLCNRFGATRVFRTAVGLFAMSSLACAASDSVPALVAARLVQGCAASMLLPLGRLLVLRDMPKHHLVTAIAVLTWPALLAPILAPPLGGFLVQTLSWRWIFLINVPIGLALYLLAPRVLPRNTKPSGRPLDLAGFALWALGATALVGGLGEAAAQPALVSVILAALVLIAGWAAVRHFRRTAHPLFDLSILQIATFRHTQTGGSLVRIAIFANPLLLPLMFQLGMGIAPVKAGFLVLVGMLGNLAMKPLTTLVLKRFAYRPILLVNGCVLTIGFALFTLIDRSTPEELLIALLIVTGMARSMHFTALNTLAFRDVPVAEMEGANLMSSCSLQLNAALGAAMAVLALSAWPLIVPSATGEPALPAFHFAFAAVAALVFLGTLEAMTLPTVRAIDRKT